MLVLARMREESIVLVLPDGRQATVTVCDIRGEKVRLGLDAPRDVQVHRREVLDAIARETRLAAGLAANAARERAAVEALPVPANDFPAPLRPYGTNVRPAGGRPTPPPAPPPSPIVKLVAARVESAVRAAIAGRALDAAADATLAGARADEAGADVAKGGR